MKVLSPISQPFTSNVYSHIWLPIVCNKTRIQIKTFEIKVFPTITQKKKSLSGSVYTSVTSRGAGCIRVSLSLPYLWTSSEPSTVLLARYPSVGSNWITIKIIFPNRSFIHGWKVSERSWYNVSIGGCRLSDC